MNPLSDITHKVRQVLSARSPERTGRVYAAIPDLHGCHRAADTAVKLLEEAGLGAMSLGDYCDRGDSSTKTIGILAQARRAHPEWRFHMGNHEQFLLQCWKTGGDFPPLFTERPAFFEYEESPMLREEHQDFFDHLYPFTETKNLIFCHAGVNRSYDQPIDRVPLEELLWTYHIDPRWKGKKIVRGHMLTEIPEECETHISCETGVWSPHGLSSIALVDDSPDLNQRLLGWIAIRREGTIEGLSLP